MLAHHRWWLATVATFAFEGIASLWLVGTAADVVTATLTVASFVCLGCFAATWFRWSQRDDVVRTPVDQGPPPSPDRRALVRLIGVIVLYFVLTNIAAATSAGTAWYKPVMTVAVILFWGFIGWHNVRTFGHSSSRP